MYGNWKSMTYNFPIVAYQEVRKLLDNVILSGISGSRIGGFLIFGHV